MASRRFTPWPAYVDLFSVLMLTMLGAFVVKESQRSDTVTSFEDCKAVLDETEMRYRECVEEVITFAPMVAAQQQARDAYDKISKMEIEGVSFVKCSIEDVCIDISLEFKLNDDKILPRDLGKLEKVSAGIRETLTALADEDATFDRQDLQIVIEGHADDIQPRFWNQRDGFRYNWNLSAKRASSVLHKMRDYNVSADAGYNVVAWGRADTDPLCLDPEPSESCRQRNRRTTIRLRFDYKSYERRGDGTTAP